MKEGSFMRGLKGLSLVSAAVIAVTAGFAQVKYSAEGVKTVNESTVTERVTLYDYIALHKDAAYANGNISLSANEAVLNGAQIKEVNGRQNAVLFDENGSAIWRVQTEKDAKYLVNLSYIAAENGTEDIDLSLNIDGAAPFYSADRISLKRIWKDDGEIKPGSNGNDIAPKQKESLEWQNENLKDYSTYYNGDIELFLTAGTHEIKITAGSPAALADITLTGKKEISSYDTVEKEYEKNGYKPAGDINLKTQAETASRKSDSTLIPVYDSVSSATESADGSLNSPSRICRNTIGQSRWETPGMWIEYDVDIQNDGLYALKMRTRQNTKVGMSALRDIYIDGALPFKEAEGFVFPYNSGWKITTFGKSEEEPYYIYLTKGKHTVRFVATLDRFSETLTELESVNSALTELYRRIVTVTGISPDSNRDYELDKEIPGLTEALTEYRDKLYSLADEYTALSAGGESQVSVIKSNAKQLTGFINDPDTIPSRLSNFQSNISSLSDWLLSAKSQALEIDYFVLSGNNAALKSQDGLFKRLAFGFNRFLASYTGDYNSVGTGDDSQRSITVWFNGSRDQAQIIQDLIEEDFTPESKISVDLSLVYQGYLESILAGCNPDVALDVARSYPVNLACRGALKGLSGFDTYKDVMSRYAANTADPYTYKNEVYGLPSTQSYFMFFYRTDIFAELGIKAPETWDDFYDIIPVLQRNNYEIGLPYSTITIAGAATGGIGAKDMFATLLFQNGGRVYNDDLVTSRLGDEEAVNAFKQWTQFYTTYGFPVTYSLLTRFRSGTLPAFIAAYSTYNSLMGAAPEIYGLWDMTPIPGTVKEDGTIDRSTGAGGTANVMFANVKDPDSCWKFLDWWSSDKAQYDYAVNLEALLGVSARLATANLYAFNKLSWGDKTKAALAEQREYVVEIPQTPAEYVISRSLDNAFRAVVYNGKNVRERYEQEIITINEEMLRKSREFK